MSETPELARQRKNRTNASKYSAPSDDLYGYHCTMSTATFDTLQAARKLQSVGFDQQKAEALADLMRQRDIDYATRTDIAQLEAATRADIGQLEAATRTDIAQLKAATRADIGQLEAAINQLRNWFVSGLITILVTILATALLPG